MNRELAGEQEVDRRSDTPVWVALGSVAHPVADPLVLTAGTGGHLAAYAHNIGALAERFRVIA
ncbi:2-hydroxy-6-oxonona-2,4-dienedioate hydrolase [Geodermatophilus ruber]|uniref:2-hydroxy-6-oxonona-2,4-dienedioate hydrolase n=1 Tax=Geodermatophilus ruber TaxID=504800 RepID=A0A1I4BY66_9ACTN|nr:2-hydroxy-6-oxonona-2,4-dienedioate hydrolase [Geodermatophilus ruber]